MGKGTGMTETPDVGGLYEWDEALYRHLTTHVRLERSLLEEYQSIAEGSSSRAFKYLVALLIDDEMRHHRIFTNLAESLTTKVLIGLEESPIPTLDFHIGNREAVVAGTKQLLRREREDIVELKQLQHQLRNVKDTTLWGILVSLMEHDTKKHIAILKFIEDHSK